jgi:hypothetical protein
VQPAFAAHFMLEMLDRIGDEGLFPRDPGIVQRLVEDPAGRADERLAGDVFFVARLLTHQHEGGVAWAFARHRLRSVTVERTARAAFLGLGQVTQRFRLCDGLVGGLFGFRIHTGKMHCCDHVQAWT